MSLVDTSSLASLAVAATPQSSSQAAVCCSDKEQHYTDMEAYQCDVFHFNLLSVKGLEKSLRVVVRGKK